MNIKKIPTVTIGVPAFNEADKIVRLLNSILCQKQKGYVIQKIIVASDGSRDKTVEIARSVKDKRIVVIDDKVNRGRIYRLNQFMKLSKSDILIFLDADEQLVDPYALKKLIDEFRVHEDVMLVSGNPFIAEVKGFVMRCHKASHDLYTNFRYKIDDGHNIFGCSGGMLALRKKFYLGLKIPVDIYADDTFMYLKCVTSGYKFRNAKDAYIAHYVHANLSTHVRRNKRYASTKDDLKKYFGDKVDEERYVSRRLLIQETIKLFFKKPVYVISIFVINRYSVLRKEYTNKKRKYAY